MKVLKHFDTLLKTLQKIFIKYFYFHFFLVYVKNYNAKTIASFF